MSSTYLELCTQLERLVDIPPYALWLGVKTKLDLELEVYRAEEELRDGWKAWLLDDEQTTQTYDELFEEFNNRFAAAFQKEELWRFLSASWDSRASIRRHICTPCQSLWRRTPRVRFFCRRCCFSMKHNTAAKAADRHFERRSTGRIVRQQTRYIATDDRLKPTRRTLSSDRTLYRLSNPTERECQLFRWLPQPRRSTPLTASI
ncbi:hypothetical protein BKA62DRAFT_700226 [Auriculariales sp. MPI-PUGE-AT-0066]|nr:hypothetical protein BKA62DRAFT_700226 [Auriculariales sp. MPI-PUGE-AT-0066]